MAHLWEQNGDGIWIATALDDDRHRLVDDGTHAVMRRQSGTPHHWTILTNDASVRLNGAPLALGIALLADRDEIRTADRTVWFTTETRPVVESLPDAAPRRSCPRCKQQIQHGSPAVRCPSCGVWHHASGEWPCWTYSSTCSVCNQPTALDAPFRWSPEDL